VFSRYGVKRSSMSDIAAEAGIARQTLYNAFSNKDEVLRAMLRLFTERATADIQVGMETASDLGDQLDVVFKHLALNPYEQLHASPHSQDIIGGFNAAGRDEIASADEAFRRIIEKILKPHDTAVRSAGLTTRQLSDFVRTSASAAKHSAETRQHLNQLLEALKVGVQKVVA
jgi:AcrR family transcriptional regulator